MDPDKVLSLANRCLGAAALVRDAARTMNADLARVHPGEDTSYLNPLNDFASWLEGSAADLTARATTIATIQAVDRLPLINFLEVVPLPAHRFASAAEADQKAKELLKKYKPKDVIDDPGKLEKLSREVAKYSSDPDFAASFVKRFGAERLVEIPRTLQFWEYQRAMSDPVGSPYHEHYRRNRKFMKDDPEHVKGILFSFSAVLATATHSADDATRQEVKKVAADDDAVALSWLMSPDDLVFDTDFLLAAFKNGVVDRIVEENLNATNEYYRESYALGGAGGRALPVDPKVKILEALARDPDAALQATDMRIKVEVHRSSPLGPEHFRIDNALDLLLRHGTYDDDGVALGAMMSAANRHLHDLAAEASATKEQADAFNERANWLTLRMAHEVTRGRSEIDGLIQSLTAILTTYHMGDLQAAVGVVGGQDFGIAKGPSLTETAEQAKVIGEATSAELLLTRRQVEDMLTAICSDSGAETEFIEALARYETGKIVEYLNPERPKEPAGEVDWAKELGMLTGVLVNAAGNVAFAKHESELERQKRKLAVFDTIMALVPMALPALGAAKAGQSVGKFFAAANLPAIDMSGKVKEAIASGPSRSKPLRSLNDFKEEARESLRAVLAATALETGMFGDKMAVKTAVEAELSELAKRRRDEDLHSCFDEQGSIIPIGQMDELQRLALDRWLGSDQVGNVIGPALNDASVEMIVAIKEY
jgi:hypothetical protein